MESLKSPEVWVRAASVFALLGFGCLMAGLVTGRQDLAIAGVALGSPLLLIQLLMLAVVSPWLVWLNHRRKGSSDPNR